ncbi:hypothetical protein J3458_019470 [Metarhizium acridum]|uniref:uncharacterized protein n=1 Tax=Metarhizium acridum TaxID=92637 RepID=UPI001C6AE48A|nr:hypothetical protein J3458_019470 [Metarhizium acridum]
MAAYYWAGSVYACQATFFAWCNDAMRYEQAAFRSVVLAGMNLGNNAVNAWWSIYSTEHQWPRGLFEACGQ